MVQKGYIIMVWVKVGKGLEIVNLSRATRLYIVDQSTRGRGVDIIADFSEQRQLVIDRVDSMPAAISLLDDYHKRLTTVETVVNNVSPVVPKAPPKKKAK